MIGQAFRVLARGTAPTRGSIRAAMALGASEDYLRAVELGADLELEHESGLDVRIWAPSGVLEMNDVYDIPRQVGGLAIGDADGLFLVERPDGLYAVGAGALEPDSLRFVASDLSELLSGVLGRLARS